MSALGSEVGNRRSDNRDRRSPQEVSTSLTDKVVEMNFAGGRREVISRRKESHSLSW